MYITAALAVVGALTASFNLFLIISPNGRFSLGSPATSMWAGIFMTYLSITAFLGVRKVFFERLVNFDYYLDLIFKNKFSVPMFYIEGVVFIASGVFLCLNFVPDYTAAVAILMNLAPLYYVISLAHENALNGKPRAKDQPEKLNSLIHDVEEVAKAITVEVKDDIQLIKKSTSSWECVWELLRKLTPLKIHIAMNLFIFLFVTQTFVEYYHEPSPIIGSTFVKVRVNGHKYNMRVYCTGPSNITTNPAILLEVGGGSSAADVMLLQSQLSTTYSVCSYDRAGYGMSW